MTDQAGFTLRPALPADAERIAALFTDEGYPAGPSDIVERLERFASPFSTVSVAETDGEVLGFVAVHLVPRFEHNDRFARIVALVVDAGVRERGVGHLLMGEAERIARDGSAAFIEITAGHHRPEARQLYESLGYDGSIAAYLRKRL
jgi:GNAT superfamily N-acetyltransferase